MSLCGYNTTRSKRPATTVQGPLSKAKKDTSQDTLKYDRR